MNLMFGKFPAIVVSNLDPEAQARLEVRVPALNLPTSWAVACLPPVDPSVVVFPEPGQAVWVEFEGGDTDRPIWTGLHWSPDFLAPAERGRLH